MSPIITNQSILFLRSLEIGILMGILFDLVRIFRKLIKHPNFLVQMEDMLYWIVCGFIGFYMLYVCNYADIRPFVFIGIILGAIFYFMTFSVVFMKIATTVIPYIKEMIRKLIKAIKKYILNPIKFMLKKLMRLLYQPILYIAKKWRHFLYINKLRYRQYKRKQYEIRADRKVEAYLKKSKS